jgi:hypothetical protein
MFSAVLLLFALSSTAQAVTIEQDQGILKIRYAQIQKDFDVKMTPNECAKESIQVATEGQKVVVKHSSQCRTGATVEMTVKNGSPLTASLKAGSAHLLEFSAIEKQVGNITVAVKHGTVRGAAERGFKSVGKDYAGRTYLRSGSAKLPAVDLAVENGIALVE